MKNEEGTKLTPASIIILVIVAILIMFAIMYKKPIQYSPSITTPSYVQTTPNPLESVIANAVTEIKASTPFPNRIDLITTWTDIKASGMSILYDFQVDNIDISSFTNEGIKSSLLTDICSIEAINVLLDNGAVLKYQYKDYQSSPIFYFEVTKVDCA
jgi:hypothetical protein